MNLKTNQMKTIYQKLAQAKSEIGAISKDSKNPFYKSKYFDINQLLQHVEPVLEKYGLMIMQPIIEGKVVSLIIDVETGKDCRSEIQLTDERDPQKIGSQISYFRRYTLSSLLSLQAEDDDANKAIPQTQTKKKFTKSDADGEFLKGTPAEELSKKYIITTEQINKYKLLTKNK
tara:strand:+ start:14322 stop:14843 length:522 start_codon:yes stop_codon:yes gene_type:complete